MTALILDRRLLHPEPIDFGNKYGAVIFPILDRTGVAMDLASAVVIFVLD